MAFDTGDLKFTVDDGSSWDMSNVLAGGSGGSAYERSTSTLYAKVRGPEGLAGYIKQPQLLTYIEIKCRFQHFWGEEYKITFADLRITGEVGVDLDAL